MATATPPADCGAGWERGRYARRPSEIGVQGFKDAADRARADVKHDTVSFLAAGVAFWALLALVPAMVAVVSVFGLVANPDEVVRTVEKLLSAAPAEVQNLFRTQLNNIVASSSTGLGLGAVFGILGALWSASSGVRHLVVALNRAYHEDESRGRLRLRLTSVLLTFGLVGLGVAALLGLVIGPGLLPSGTPGAVLYLVLVLRWVVAAAVLVVALAVVYRYGPSRDDPQWRWTSPGAIVATVLWLIASAGFSIYTANFGHYNETYGALGAIIVTMLWLYIGAYAVIAGAELNGELERQTYEDTTAGPARPLGERGAFVADTVGESKHDDAGVPQPGHAASDDRNPPRPG